MLNNNGQTMGIVHGFRYGGVGQEGNKLVNCPVVRDRRDEVSADQAKAESREPGTVGKKMRSSLRSLEAEAEVVESVNGVTDCATRRALGVESSQSRPRVAENLDETRTE